MLTCMSSKRLFMSSKRLSMLTCMSWKRLFMSSKRLSMLTCMSSKRLFMSSKRLSMLTCMSWKRLFMSSKRLSTAAKPACISSRSALNSCAERSSDRAKCSSTRTKFCSILEMSFCVPL